MNNETKASGQIMDEMADDFVYTVIHNKTQNQKVCLSSLGIEIGPGQTLNLREMFRKPKLMEATEEIHHFIKVGVLEVVIANAGVPDAPAGMPTTQAPKTDIKAEMTKKVQDLKVRDALNEIKDCSSLSRLEDVYANPETAFNIKMDSASIDEIKKETKIKYMQIRGWVDENGVLIEGSADDDGNDILSIDAWEFSLLRPSNL